MAHELIDDDTSDAAMAGTLVSDSGGTIRRVIADGAYDGAPTTAAIRDARPAKSPPKIVVPPRVTSIPPPGEPHGGSERECHAAEIASHGRMAGQKRHDYGLRSLVETGIARIKGINGGKITTRTFGAQRKGTAIQIAALNRMIHATKPNIIKVA